MKPRVMVFRDGSVKHGKVVVVGDDFGSFLEACSRKLGIEATRVFLRPSQASGGEEVEVEGVDEMRDGDALWVRGVSAASSGELESFLSLSEGAYVDGAPEEDANLSRVMASTLARVVRRVESLSSQLERVLSASPPRTPRAAKKEPPVKVAASQVVKADVAEGESADRVRRAAQAKPFHLKGSLVGHEGPVWCVHYIARRGIILTGSADCTIKVWGSSDRKLRYTLKGHTSIVHALASGPQGKLGNYLFSASADKSIKVWDLNTVGCVHTTQEPDCVLSLALSDRYLFSGGYHAIRVYDPFKEDFPLIKTLTGHHHWVRALHVAEGYLFSGCHNLILIHQTSSLTLIRRIDTGGIGRSIYSLQVVSSLLFSASYDNVVAVYDLAKGGELSKTLTGHSGAVYAVARGGSFLFTGSYDCSLRVWDLSTGQESQVIKKAHDSKVEDVLATPDGLVYTASSDATVKVWGQ